MSNPYEQQPLPPQAAWQPPRPVTKQKNGLAISALVVAVLALLMVLGLFVSQFLGALFLGGLSSSFPGGMNGMNGTEGTAPQVVSGQAYPGQLLQDEITRVVGGTLGEVTSMSCPVTPTVAAGAVTDCQGTVDGSDWSFKIRFEDGLGHFTMDEKMD